jgi:hypothetical protein
VHDIGQDFLARAVGTRDEHRHVGVRNLGGHRGHGMQRIAFVDEAFEVVSFGKRGARLGAMCAGADVFLHRGAQLEQIAHRGQKPRVVPGLGDVVGSAGLHQIHRGLEMRPRRQQDDRDVRVQCPQLAEQGDAFLA